MMFVMNNIRLILTIGYLFDDQLSFFIPSQTVGSSLKKEQKHWEQTRFKRQPSDIKETFDDLDVYFSGLSPKKLDELKNTIDALDLAVEPQSWPDFEVEIPEDQELNSEPNELDMYFQSFSPGRLQELHNKNFMPTLGFLNETAKPNDVDKPITQDEMLQVFKSNKMDVNFTSGDYQKLLDFIFSFHSPRGSNESQNDVNRPITQEEVLQLLRSNKMNIDFTRGDYQQLLDFLSSLHSPRGSNEGQNDVNGPITQEEVLQLLRSNKTNVDFTREDCQQLLDFLSSLHSPRGSNEGQNDVNRPISQEEVLQLLRSNKTNVDFTRGDYQQLLDCLSSLHSPRGSNEGQNDVNKPITQGEVLQLLRSNKTNVDFTRGDYQKLLDFLPSLNSPGGSNEEGANVSDNQELTEKEWEQQFLNSSSETNNVTNPEKKRKVNKVEGVQAMIPKMFSGQFANSGRRMKNPETDDKNGAKANDANAVEDNEDGAAVLKNSDSDNESLFPGSEFDNLDVSGLVNLRIDYTGRREPKGLIFKKMQIEEKSKRMQSIANAAVIISSNEFNNYTFRDSVKMLKGYLLKLEESTNAGTSVVTKAGSKVGTTAGTEIPTYQKLAIDFAQHNLKVPEEYNAWKIPNHPLINDVLFQTNFSASLINEKSHLYFRINSTNERIYKLYKNSPYFQRILRVEDFMLLRLNNGGEKKYLTELKKIRLEVAFYRLALRECEENWTENRIKLYHSKYIGAIFKFNDSFIVGEDYLFDEFTEFNLNKDVEENNLRDWKKASIRKHPVLMEIEMENSIGLVNMDRIFGDKEREGKFMIAPNTKFRVVDKRSVLLFELRTIIVKMLDKRLKEEKMIDMINKLYGHLMAHPEYFDYYK